MKEVADKIWGGQGTNTWGTTRMTPAQILIIPDDGKTFGKSHVHKAAATIQGKKKQRDANKRSAATIQGKEKTTGC